MAKKYWTYKGEKIPVKRYNPKTKKTADALYREAIRKTGQANKRLRDIKNEFGTLGWAGKKLKEKVDISVLDAWRSKGVKVSKSMSEKQLKAVIKAIDDFLQSKTSNVKGIKQTIKKSQDSLRKTLSTEDINVTAEESKTLYSFFEDTDFNTLVNYLGASETFALIQDAKESNDNSDEFISRIERYIMIGEDEDMKQSLENIYNKYVRS